MTWQRRGYIGAALQARQYAEHMDCDASGSPGGRTQRNADLHKLVYISHHYLRGEDA